jgi:hypothetical protein
VVSLFVEVFASGISFRETKPAHIPGISKWRIEVVFKKVPLLTGRIRGASSINKMIVFEGKF